MMKVLHVNNVASVGEMLSCVQERELNYETNLINIIPHQDSFTFWKKILTLLQRVKLVLIARFYINKFKPSVVHVHYSTSAIWFVGVKAKIVVHAHGSDIRLDRGDRVRKCLNKIGLKKADILLYSTPDLKHNAEEYKVVSKYCPNPIDMELYKCERRFKFQSDSTKILLLATPVEIKGFSIASESIRKILEIDSKATVTILKNKNSVKFVEENQLNRVTLISQVRQEDVVNLISDHDVIIGQFYLGSYGMSELQALSCGKPLICNAINNMDFSFGTPHFQSSSVEETIRHYQSLLDFGNADFERVYNESQRYIKIQHDIKNVIKYLDEIYKKIGA